MLYLAEKGNRYLTSIFMGRDHIWLATNIPLEEVHPLCVKQKVGVAMEEVAPGSRDVRGGGVLR